MAVQKDFGPVSGPASPAFDPNAVEFDTAAGLPALGKAEGKLPGALRRPLTARIIALALVLAAVVGLGGGKLAAKAADVAALYEKGTPIAGGAAVISIPEELTARAQAAAGIVGMGKTLLGMTDPLVTSAAEALDALYDAEGPAEQYAANTQLAAAINSLYQQLKPIADESDRGQTLQTQWSEFLSRQDILSQSSYNEEAQAFNKTLSSFPAVLLGGIWQIEKVELFA